GTGGEPFDKGAVGRELVNEPIPRAFNIVVRVVRIILLREGNKQGAVDVMDAKGREAEVRIRIGERADELEVLVEDVHTVVMEIAGEDDIPVRVRAQRERFEDRSTVGKVSADDSLVPVHFGVEAGYGAIFGGDYEASRGASSALTDDEVGRRVQRAAVRCRNGAGRTVRRRWDDDRPAQDT